MSDQVMHIQAKNYTMPRITFLDCSLRPSEYLSDNGFDYFSCSVYSELWICMNKSETCIIPRGLTERQK